MLSTTCFKHFKPKTLFSTYLWKGGKGIKIENAKTSYYHVTTNSLKLCHEIYQNSNSRSCHQIEWNIKITAQNIKRRYKLITRKGKDGQTWKDWNGLQLRFCQPNSFTKFIFVVFNVWYNAWETYLFDRKLSFTCNFLSP